MNAIIKIEPKKTGYWACTVKIRLDGENFQEVMKPIGRGYKSLEAALAAGFKKAAEWGGPRFESEQTVPYNPGTCENESTFIYRIWFKKAKKTDEY